MLDLLTIKSRLITIFKISCGRHDKLSYLDISEKGFKQSFQGLYVAMLALFVEIIFNFKFNPEHESFPQIALNSFGSFLIIWFLPLGIIVSTLYLLQAKNKITSLIIAYNWFYALMSLFYLPLTVISILLAEAPNILLTLLIFLYILSFYMTYHVFSAALRQNFIFNFGISLFSFLSPIIIMSVSNQLFG